MPLHPEAVPEFCFIVPCSPVPAKAVPVGDGWLHEVKFDGYRVQVHKVGSRIVLFSHNGHRLALLRVAEQRGLEGVVSKRRDAPYRSGARSRRPPGTRRTGNDGGCSSANLQLDLIGYGDASTFRRASPCSNCSSSRFA